MYLHSKILLYLEKCKRCQKKVFSILLDSFSNVTSQNASDIHCAFNIPLL